MLKKSYLLIPILLISLNINSASLIDIGKEQEKKQDKQFKLTARFNNDFSAISCCNILYVCLRKLCSCFYAPKTIEISATFPVDTELASSIDKVFNEHGPLPQLLSFKIQ